MPIFSVNTSRFDPYKSYRFLVYFGQSTTPVAAVSKVTALKRTTDVIEYKEGGRNLVVSRRAHLEDEQRASAAEIRRKVTPTLREILHSAPIRPLFRGSGDRGRRCLTLPVGPGRYR